MYLYDEFRVSKGLLVKLFRALESVAALLQRSLEVRIFLLGCIMNVMNQVCPILKPEKETCAYLIYFLKFNESLIGDHEALPVCGLYK